jgi:predicted NBD/HSP70 family sugar kinase
MVSQSFLDMRTRNAVRILQAVRDRPGLSRADIARGCELAKSTVSAIVDELVRDSMLQETGSKASSRGRRPVGLVFNPGSRMAAGISLDYSRTEYVLCDLEGVVQVVHTKKHSRRKKLQYTSSSILIDLEGLLTGRKFEKTKVGAIGLAVPGPLSSGYVVSDSGEKIDYETLRDLLSKQSKCPVLLDSNINMAALAEGRLGAARNSQEALVVRLGHEVRSALIIDHKQLKGAGSCAGELGHVTVPGVEALCTCGRRGCINSVASIDAIILSCRTAGGRAQDIEEVIAGAMHGDSACKKALTDAGRAVGYGIAACINILAPRDVIVTGRLVGAGNNFLSALHQALAQHAIAENLGNSRLVFDDSQRHLEAIGASLAALQQEDFMQNLVSD